MAESSPFKDLPRIRRAAAIESFAVMVKDVAQLLQVFGTEMAETELPEEPNTIQLLSQLRDMETAFDGFFEKHHLKMQQYLQLLRYEQNFHERVSACMPWSPAPISGCSGCFDVPPNSKGAPVYSDESGSSSPVLTDPVMFSPRPQNRNRRSWPGTSNSVDICETLEDWTTDLSFISDSDEEDDVLLVAGKYRALLDHLKCGKDEVIIKHGDVIHLLRESTAGQWHIKNLTRGGEGKLSADALHRILGNINRSHVIKPRVEFKVSKIFFRTFFL
ncbi:Guanine nucleotide exchange factor DBS [Bagarius yarrelli]|uniref:Guanine nucleotide exchange factor DBS n=1 Tax=Bagarius yarrelli TaxID=175774 RepID=A0A556VVI3_BAGYA|nr:Guanine nucleotide exchange factor DBS [Bagarius yarrelli]